MTTTSITNLAGTLPARSLLDRRAIAWMLGLATLFVAYHVVFLERTWMFATTDRNWSHALIVPLIGLYYIYQHRDRLAAARFHPGWLGLPILFFGLFGYAFGIYPVRNDMAQGYSMIASLFGLVLLLAGPGAMRVLWFPVCYLVFAVKISDRIWSDIAWRLQHAAAEGATIALKFFTVVLNFDVSKRGNTIELEMLKAGSWQTEALNVAEACSGLRMLMAFVALATAMAFLWDRTWWQRAAIIALAVPIAVFVNVIRVTVLGLLALVNTDLIHGEVHTYIGMAMLLPAAGLFWLVGWVLERIVIREHDESDNTQAHESANAETHHVGDGSTTGTSQQALDETTAQRIKRALLGLGAGALVTLIAGGVYAGMIMLEAPTFRLPALPALVTQPAMKLAWTLLPPALIGGALGWAVLRWLRARFVRPHAPSVDPRRAPTTVLTYCFVAGALLTVIAGQSSVLAATRAVLIKDPLPLRHPLLMMPDQAGPWTLEREDPPMSADMLETLGTQTYVSRVYRDTSWPDEKPGGLARLHVAYYTGTPGTVPHVPERCFVAGGLRGLGKGVSTITLDRDALRPVANVKNAGADTGFITDATLEPNVYLPARRIKASRFTFAHPDHPDRAQNVLYFFIANGQFMHSPDMVRLHGFDPQDQYSYYCKVEIQLFGVKDRDLARQRAGAMATHLLPQIMACLPDWRAVKRGDWPTPEAAARAKRSGG